MFTRRTAPVLAIVALVAAIALFYGPRPTASQVNSAIPQEARKNASAILATDAARYLSGDGLNALKHLSSNVPATRSGRTGRSLAESIEENEEGSVLVNNPSEDIFTIDDISSQSETAVAGFGSTIVVTFNDSSGAVFPNNSLMGYSQSTDGGASFTDLGNLPTPATGFNEGDPGLVVNRVGHFYASSISFDFARPAGFENTIGIAKSTDGGSTFTFPVYLPPAGVQPYSFQDKPFIAVDTTTRPTGGNVYVTFTSFPATFFAAQLPIMFSRSTDGGASFSVPIQLSQPGTFNQGSEPVVGPSGEIYVAWLQFFGPGGTGIVVARSTDGGVSFGLPVFAAPVLQIGFASGEMMGNFRVNSFPRMDVDPTNGNVYLTYAGRFSIGDSGDVFFVRSVNGGASWSTPIRINDDLGNKDQFFPDVAVNSAGVIRLYWYDKRKDHVNLRMTLFTAISTNGGLSFHRNEQLINASFLPGVGYDPVLNPIYMGDYIDIKAGLDTLGNRTEQFLMAWTDCRRIVTTIDGVHPDQDVRFTKR
jgi:hypothetical protein